jgi:transcription initiation factor TFIID TATA-box-binding protein
MKLSKIPGGIFDQAIYGGRCGYIKTPEMDGRVTIFTSGKMISLGGKSVKKANEQINHAKFFLVQKNMIDEIKLIPKIQNIVARFDFGEELFIEKLARTLPKCMYEPEHFPGLIFRIKNSCTALIFASGKGILAGAKSIEELNYAFYELKSRIF